MDRVILKWRMTTKLSDWQLQRFSSWFCHMRLLDWWGLCLTLPSFEAQAHRASTICSSTVCCGTGDVASDWEASPWSKGMSLLILWLNQVQDKDRSTLGPEGGEPKILVNCTKLNWKEQSLFPITIYYQDVRKKQTQWLITKSYLINPWVKAISYR